MAPFHALQDESEGYFTLSLTSSLLEDDVASGLYTTLAADADDRATDALLDVLRAFHTSSCAS